MSARRRIVVVGAGSCGCVVAERLTRGDAVEVVLVEQGPAGASDAELRLATLPIGEASDRVTRHAAVGGHLLPRGRGLGGSSAVNGGYFMRWHDADFADWDRRWWNRETISRAYADIDGGPHGGGAMSVRRVADDELHPVAHAFEKHWQEYGFDLVEGVTPRVGVNRVRSNSRRSLRVPVDRAYLRRARDRTTLSVRAIAPVDRLLIDGAGVRGVRLRGGEMISADETILCAGTLASAALIARSTGRSTTHPISEHRELLVRYRLATDTHTASDLPLLPTVLHTAEHLEIRCYNGDFAQYIAGVVPRGAAIGVALMAPRARGSLVIDADGGQQIDLGDVHRDDDALLRSWAQRVAQMLRGGPMNGLIDPAGVRIDDEVLTSQHAWGSMPMGDATDWHGGVLDLERLRVIDGSILPGPGSSGPHETLMMAAATIAARIASDRW